MIKPRNPYAVAAGKRKAGPMGDRRKKRKKQKDKESLRLAVLRALEAL